MPGSPYRDGSTSTGPRVHRTRLRHLAKYALATLVALAITVAIVLRMATDEVSWEGLGLLAMFATATGILAFFTNHKRRRRVVLDEDGISCTTGSKTVLLHPGDIASVERIVVNGEVTYVLHPRTGERIVLDEGLEGFDELTAGLRERLGPLPGDADDGG
ncbi:MAG TPA: hypothetical protein RMH99_32445 [Sandaracinaceae bacterium LLY-WYZ-13_1]|nr:hypothetical protein [Sandaracinaceae bacterium LLY-WYZ-13_1]